MHIYKKNYGKIGFINNGFVMKKYCISLLTLVAFAEIHGITFEDAVVAACKNNSGWLAEQTDDKIAIERHLMSKLKFLPNVAAKISSARTKNDDNLKRKSYSTDTNMGVNLTQNIFNGGATLSQMHAAENTKNASYHKVRVAEQELILKVLNAYTGIWFGRNRVVALQTKESNLKKTLHSQELALGAGAGTSSEVALAMANYQKAIFERINAETELFSAESEFYKLTGIKADNNLELPDFSKIQISDDLNVLIKTAMRTNDKVMFAKLSEKAALDNLLAVKGKLAPSCDVALHYGKRLQRDKNSATHHYSSSATVEFSVPIFENNQYSGNTYSEIAIAEQGALKAQFISQDTISETEKECVVNLNTYKSAEAMIESSRSAVKSAELSSSSNMEESVMGLKSNTDVWVKENQLLESRIDLLNSRRQKMITKAKLLALIGKLNLENIFAKKINALKKGSTVSKVKPLVKLNKSRKKR